MLIGSRIIRKSLVERISWFRSLQGLYYWSILNFVVDQLIVKRAILNFIHFPVDGNCSRDHLNRSWLEADKDPLKNRRITLRNYWQVKNDSPSFNLVVLNNFNFPGCINCLSSCWFNIVCIYYNSNCCICPSKCCCPIFNFDADQLIVKSAILDFLHFFWRWKLSSRPKLTSSENFKFEIAKKNSNSRCEFISWLLPFRRNSRPASVLWEKNSPERIRHNVSSHWVYKATERTLWAGSQTCEAVLNFCAFAMVDSTKVHKGLRVQLEKFCLLSPCNP